MPRTKTTLRLAALLATLTLAACAGSPTAPDAVETETGVGAVPAPGAAASTDTTAIGGWVPWT